MTHQWVGIIIWKTLPCRIESELFTLVLSTNYSEAAWLFGKLYYCSLINVFFKKSCFLESSLLHNYQMTFHFCFPDLKF